MYIQLLIERDGVEYDFSTTGVGRRVGRFVRRGLLNHAAKVTLELPPHISTDKIAQEFREAGWRIRSIDPLPDATGEDLLGRPRPCRQAYCPVEDALDHLS